MLDESISALEERRARLCRQLVSIGEMRSGSLMARCRRCGKTGCGYAPPGEAERGPVLSLTRKQSGKTVIRIIRRRRWRKPGPRRPGIGGSGACRRS